MNGKKIISLAILTLFVLAACVTVNIYFPAAEVQKAADKIVGDVRGGGMENSPREEKPPVEGEKESWLNQGMPYFGLGARPAFAAMDIDITTPAIRSLKASLKDRFTHLKPFYDAAHIGENNQGLVEVKDLGGLGLKEKSQMLRLVEEENKDRDSLYNEILNANKLGPEHLSEVKRIFSNSWRNEAPKGWWIQKDDGEWVKK